MDLKDILIILPDILLYIAAGYIFIFMRSFISLKKNIDDIQGLFVISLFVGYALKALVALLPIRVNYYWNIVGFLIACAILGVVLGWIEQSKCVRKLLDFFNIHRTVNANIWHDVLDPDGYPVWVRVVDHENDRIIIGILKTIEEFNDTPKIILQQYGISDLDGNPIQNYIQDEHKHIMIDTAKYSEIELIYDEKSSITKKRSVSYKKV